MAEDVVKLKAVDKIYHYGRMAVIIIFASSTVIMAYYQIFENKDNISLFKKDHEVKMKSIKIRLTKEFDLRDRRSDKRYNRAMKYVEEFNTEQKEMDKRIRKLEQDLAYEKGKGECE